MNDSKAAVSSYPGYATPTFHQDDDGHWIVGASPWALFIGFVCDHHIPLGCVAYTMRNHRVGLFPDKQAAGEALVKHAGYEVLR